MIKCHILRYNGYINTQVYTPFSIICLSCMCETTCTVVSPLGIGEWEIEIGNQCDVIAHTRGKAGDVIAVPRYICIYVACSS